MGRGITLTFCTLTLFGCDSDPRPGPDAMPPPEPPIGCQVPTVYATIAAALADAQCTTIALQAGTYRERLELARSVTLVGAANETVILDGEAAGTVLSIAAGVDVTLRTLTVANGRAEVGGGIVNRGVLTLDRAVVRDNLATGQAPAGGGIANLGGELTLSGARVSNNQVVAAAASTPLLRVLRGGGISSTGGTLELRDGSELRGNQVLATASPNGSLAGKGGGGLAASDTVVSLRGATVRDNSVEVEDTFIVEAYGGGLWIERGSLTMREAAIAGNKSSAVNPTGAAAAGGGIRSNAAALDLASSTIEENLAYARAGSSSTVGGGVSMVRGSLLAVGVNVRSNTARSEASEERPGGATGGGMAIFAETISIASSRLVDNRALAGGDVYGGGLAMSLYPSARLERSTIAGNLAASQSKGAKGGGIYAAPTQTLPATLTILQSTISANRASGIFEVSGGGLGAYLSTDQELTADLINSTVSNNVVETTLGQAVGGGVLGEVTENTDRLFLRLSSATITQNSAIGPGDFGSICGGLCLGGFIDRNDSRLSVRNSIVAGNLAATAPDCRSVLPVLSGGYNFFSEVGSCALTGSPGGELLGAVSLLNLGALADNGGVTKTHALGDGSAAINAGNPAGCTDADGAALTTDQRGQPRGNDGRCDIGAFER